MKVIRILFRMIFWLIVLAIGGVVALAYLVDPNEYKTEITEWVEQESGRELSLSGDIELAYFPWLGVKLGEFEFLNTPEFGSEPMVAAEELSIMVKVLPLILQRVEISKVVMEAPQINLSRMADGSTNWDDLAEKFEWYVARHDGRHENNAHVRTGSVFDVDVLDALVVHGISIANGLISWDDRLNNRILTLDELNLNASKWTIGKPLHLSLSVAVDDITLPVTTMFDLETTALLSRQAGSFKLDSSELDVTTDSINASVKIPVASYALASGRLQLPQIDLKQDELTLSASASGVWVSDSPITLDGNIKTEIEDIARFLKRTELKLALPPVLDNPVVADLKFNLADNNLTVTDLKVKQRTGKLLSTFEKVVLPFEHKDSGLELNATEFIRLNSTRTVLHLGTQVLTVMKWWKSR